MSPKVSRPAGEPDEPGLPLGHVPMRPPPRPTPEPKKPIPLGWKVGGYVALLVATVAIIAYLGRPEDPRSSARGTAEVVAKSLTDGDMSAFRSYLCTGGILKSPSAWLNLGTTTVLSVADEGDDEDEATALLKSRGFRVTEVTLLLHDEDGSWCVFGATQG